ncbi:MAG: DnaA regulatory inactivator Hda [Pseudoxanthomonas sp.]|nr:DnaA regulatory inactivator Hda [Pseudoxanthomonas sp.]
MSVPQLPLALRYPPDQRLDSYLEAPPGLLAQLDALARSPAGWVYLAGASGSGKTHLCLAVCAATEQAGRRAGYLPLATARGRLGEALHALEGNDLVALDGLEHIAGQVEDEVALFDFHNRARSAGSNLLYAATEMPDALGLQLPDLRSRLSQCIRIGLATVDDAGRRGILSARAQRRGLVLEDAAMDWMLTRTGRDLGSLLQLLDKLDRESLAAQRRVTVPFLKQVIARP